MNTEERIKKIYSEEIKRLKRQLTYKGEFEAVTTKKSLAKVRSDLKQASKQIKDDQAFKKKWSNLPPGMSVIDSALQAASQA